MRGLTGSNKHDQISYVRNLRSHTLQFINVCFRYIFVQSFNSDRNKFGKKSEF